MGVIELFNTIILVVGITFGVMLVSKLVISTLAEESRKNEDHAMKLLDKFFDRFKVDMLDIFRGIKKIEEEPSVNDVGPTKRIEEEEPDFETDIKNRVVKAWKE